MLTVSYRIAALFGAGAMLVGWISASLVVPPTIVSQERPQPRRVVAAPQPIPPLALDAVRAPRVGPVLGRNPFEFSPARGRAAARADAEPTSSSPESADTDLAAVAPTEPPPVPWRLAGLAIDEAAGVTAIVTGDGDVHLLRTGDTLGDATVDEVSASGVTLRFDTGRILTLRLP